LKSKESSLQHSTTENELQNEFKNFLNEVDADLQSIKEYFFLSDTRVSARNSADVERSRLCAKGKIVEVLERVKTLKRKRAENDLD
tara:strand:+ start:542 stop:799 length:258 start_codon:yes stop_codon:yes gene_type:complete